MDEAKLVGRRVRELRCWRGLTLREAAGLAGLSFSFWGQVEHGEKPVTKLGVDPEVPVRAWPQIQADLDRLVHLHHHVVDYAAAGQLVPVLIGELQSAYVRLAAAAPGGAARVDRCPSGGHADREGSW